MKTNIDSEHVVSKTSLSNAGGNQTFYSPLPNVSQETRLNTTAKHPQGCPIHFPVVKFESISSQPVASSSNTSPTANVNNINRNGPVRRKSTEIIASPPPKEEQIKAPALAKLNIKVRDFAFESTLPPIAPFQRTLHPPLQVQAGPRPLKRYRHEWDQEDNDPFRVRPIQPLSSRGGLQTKKPKPLERENTEPADPSQPPPPSRERGYADLAEYQPASQSQSQPAADSASSPHTPAKLTPLHISSQTQNPSTPDYSSQSQPLPLFAFSQESEPYIDTPLVTPNGSLQWPTTDVQIGSIPESQMDTESQLPPPELLTYSQLGFSPLESQIDNPSQSRQESPLMLPSTFQFQSSPLSAPPSSSLPRFSPPNGSPGPSTEPSHPGSSTPPSRRRSRSPQCPKEQLSLAAGSPSHSPSPPRYNFRKRHATSPSPPPVPLPSQRTTRSRSRQPRPSSSRPRQISMQSAHAKSKSQSSKSSLRPKIIRKLRSVAGTKANGQGHDDRMITG